MEKRCKVSFPRFRHAAVALLWIVAAAWRDDAVKVQVNGEAAFPYVGYTDRYHPYYFSLPLKAGWNAVLVKCADSYKAWGYTLRVADPEGALRFSRAATDD